MLFYRSSTSSDPARGPKLGTIRLLTAFSLLGYPAGGLILALGADGRDGLFAFEIGGLALIMLSLLAAMPVLGSHFQRIVGEQPAALDEFELHLRHRATSGAYALFTALALLAIIYAAIGSDFGLWVPRSYDEYNALFWGAFLYACLLPTTVLAWQLRTEDGS